MEVHGVLGPDRAKSAYEECLGLDLALRGVPFERQRL